jgi:hypothetical protein
MKYTNIVLIALLGSFAGAARPKKILAQLRSGEVPETVEAQGPKPEANIAG